MKTIKINKINLDIKSDALDRDFTVFKIIHKSPKDLWKSEFLDAFPKGHASVLAVCYRNDSIYILASNKNNLQLDVKNEIKDIPVSISYKEIKTLNPTQLKKEDSHILLQLMLNASARTSAFEKNKSYTELSGKCLFNHAGWKNKDGNGKPLYSYVDILINKDMTIELNVITYSLVDNPREAENRTMYIIEDGVLKRTTRFVPDRTFVNKRFDNQKASINFLDIENQLLFLQSKMGLLSMALELFKDEWEDYVTLSLTDIPLKELPEEISTGIKSYKSKFRKRNQQWIAQHNYISVTNVVNDGVSSLLYAEICKLLQNEFCFTIIPPQMEVPEIRIIHNKEWYQNKKIADPYMDNSPKTLQHITLENAVERSKPTRHLKSIIESCINNIIIKEDIKNKQVYIVDWDSLIGQQMSFAIKYATTTNDFTIVIMNIDKDGKFTFKQEKCDIFTNSKDPIIVELTFNENPNLIGLVSIKNSLIQIEETNLFTIPELDLIEQEFRKNINSDVKNKISRSEESRDKLYKAAVDINFLDVKDDFAYYFNVGVVGSGMNSKIPKASRIRKISIIKGEDFCSDILKLLTVGQVRNGQYTVIPFPFKYIKEHILAYSHQLKNIMDSNFNQKTEK